MGRREPVRVGLGERALGEGLRRPARGSHEDDKGVGAARCGPAPRPYLLAALRALVAFLAGALRAVVLRAVALRAGALLAGAFFAGALLAAAGADDLPAAVTAALSVGKTPLLSFGAVAGASTASLNAFTGVMRAFFDA